MATTILSFVEEYMTKKPPAAPALEIGAISAVHAALKALEPEVQRRVMNYVALMLKIPAPTSEIEVSPDLPGEKTDDAIPKKGGSEPDREGAGDELEGISPVAKKWMARNGLEPNALSKIFSLGVDEIDLIAKTVPGKNKKERMHSVFLLKGVAAYLGAGAARFTHEQIKETCLHYDAFDAANFAVYYRSLSADVSGTKDTGYALTPRGLASATEVVKGMTQLSKAS